MSDIVVSAAESDIAEISQPQTSLLVPKPEAQVVVAKAQAECFNFSTLMYRKLPKELRDLVYSYLCLEDRQIPIGPYYHFRKYELSQKAALSDTQYFPRDGDYQTELSDGKTRTDHDIHPQDDLILPGNHIFRPSYMGRDVVLEMLEKYYQSNSFSVCNIEGALVSICTAIKLGPEASRTSFVPIDHIRDLQIRLKCEHFTKDISNFEAYPGYQMQKLAKIKSFLRGTVDSLQELRTRLLIFSHELNIEIVLMTDLEKVHKHGTSDDAKVHVTNFLQTVRNMIYELLHDCEHITVRVTHQDDGLMAFPRNYTGLFKLTKEQWEYEKSKQHPDCDWSDDFWILPVSTADLPKCDQLRLGGYLINNLDAFLASRWGVDDILRETVSTKPVVEGPYWPIGRPVDPAFVKELHDMPSR